MLATAFENFKGLYRESEFIIERLVADSTNRIYTYIIRRKDERHFFFVAKDSTLENSDDPEDDTVSVHEDMCERSLRWQFPIVMMLKGKFYVLTAKEIFEHETMRNVRFNEHMINFRLCDVRAIDITNPTAHASVMPRLAKKKEPENQTAMEL